MSRDDFEPEIYSKARELEKQISYYVTEDKEHWAVRTSQRETIKDYGYAIRALEQENYLKDLEIEDLKVVINKVISQKNFEIDELCHELQLANGIIDGLLTSEQ